MTKTFSSIDVVLIITFSFFTLFPALFCFVFVKDLIRGVSSYSWASTAGEVISESFSSNDRKTSLIYEFDVDGRSYRSDRISYSGNQEVNQQIIDALEKGASVTIFFDPSHPERSVLKKGIDIPLLIWVLIPLMMTLAIGSFDFGLIAAARGREKLMGASVDVFVISFLALFTLIPMALTGLLTLDILNGVRSTSWPSIEGKILSSEIVATEESERIDVGPHAGFSKNRQSFSNQITYLYEVGGKKYRGSRIDFNRVFPTKKNIESRLKNYQKDQPAKVFYNPDDPSKAVLETGTGLYDFIYLGMSLLFLVVFGGLFFRKIL